MSEHGDLRSELFEHAPCGLLSTLPRGRIVAVNDTLVAWLGYPRDDLLGGKRLQQLMGAPGRVFYDTHLAPLLRLQGFVNEIATDLVRQDGSRLPVLVSFAESRTERGDVRFIHAAVFLAADRRRYERELLLGRRMAEQALQAKSDFLGVFAHEVGNALGPVQLITERLARAEVPPDARRSVEKLQRALDRALGLLRNMLDFSRIEAGKVALERRCFDVGELVQGIAQTLEATAEQKQVPLRVELDPELPQAVVGDPIKIGQVITNLAGNAVKFTSSGAVTIAVRNVRRSEREVVIRFRISDTGIGIAPEQLDRIFEDYAQAGPEIAPRYGGAGLGLAISRRIVELHGSRIHVDSRLGAGTTFWFELALPLPGPDPEVLHLAGQHG